MDNMAINGKRAEEKSVGEKDIYQKSRLLYIIEAALEYFVATLVGGAYLARLTAAKGEDGFGVLLSYFNEDEDAADIPLTVSFDKECTYSVYITDAEHKGDVPVKENASGDLPLVMRKNTTVFLRGK